MLFFYILFLFKFISSQSNYCDNNFIEINLFHKNRLLLEEDFNLSFLFKTLLMFMESKEQIINSKETIFEQLNAYLSNKTNTNDIRIIKLNKTLDDFFSLDNKYFNETIDAILDNKNILNKEIEEMIDKNSDIEFLVLLASHEDILNPILSFVKENPDIANILFLISGDFDVDKDEKEKILGNITEFLIKYIDIVDLIPFALNSYNIDEDKFNYTKIYNNISDYCLNHINFTFDVIGLFVQNPNLSRILNTTFENSKDNRIKKLLNYLYMNQGQVNELYEICKNDIGVIKVLPEIIANLDNKRKLIFIILTDKNILKHKELIAIFANMAYSILERGDNADDFVFLMIDLVQGIVEAFLYNDKERISEEISEKCLKFINYTILGYDFEKNESYAANVSKFFVYKALIDTTKSSNDLLTYDNCLKKPIILTDLDIKEIEQYGVVPAFIISTMDNSVNENKNKFKKSTQIEETYHVSSICLPKGIKEGKNKELFLDCSDKEYSKIIGQVFNIFADTTKTEIKSISLKKNQKITEKTSGWAIAFGKLIPFYIILIPFILFLILFICKNKNSKNKIQNNDDSLENDDSQNIDQNEPRIERKTKSRWIIYLNEFFNLFDNGKELFNFESKITNFNNINGLKYICGLLGISILLTILGQIYLILYNLPMKDYGPSNFYNLFNDFFYIFFFIGLRYSPRIIFSCSGFTLSFKYISFITNFVDKKLNLESNKESINCCLKFIFRHFFKYIILIIFILFGRYSYYYLLTIIFNIEPIYELFNMNVLFVPEESSDFALSLFFIKSFQFNKIDSRVRHYFTDYFWMPINEIIFFIFGTIIITVGYRYKLRIDLGIIIFAILLYFGKIIFYYIYYYKKENIYTTLYYYLFDYGEIMLNPIFNLPYYLIGMYFGLINYSLENGITYEKEKPVELISNDIDNDKEENNEFNNNIIRKGSSFNEISSKLDDIKENELLNKSDVISEKRQINKKLLEKNKGKNKENNKNISEISQEIKSMPFLKSPVLIKEWHVKTNIIFFYILLIFLSLIISLFICAHYFFIWHYNNKIENNINNEMHKILVRLSLENIITNKFLNFISLIDIEPVVFFIQWGFFILLIKQQFIIEFFNHIYWTFFNKFYFSFSLVCNFSILYIFYQTETVIKLNTFNLWLYFFISTVLIFIVTFIIYIAYELPLKKISKYLLSKDYKIDFGEQYINKIDEQNDELMNNNNGEDEDNIY